MANYRAMQKDIPEEFLWYTFECLCIAGLVLERGEMEKNPMSQWTPIVHRDLKVSNVFLGLPNRRHFSRYPVPKVGDFGLAAYLPDGKLTAKEAFGTPANYPIEHDPRWMAQMEVDWPMTPKTNVWGIANIVASLLIQREGFADLKDPTKQQEPEFTESQEARFSSELLQLIRHCMRYDPNKRPELAEVLKSMLDRRTGLRDEPENSKRWNEVALDEGAIDIVRLF